MNAQEIYTKYLSKEYTEKDFLWHMRRDPMLKEYISPVNSKEDVIKILTNRGIIWENKTQETTEPYDAFKAFANKMNEVADDDDESDYDDREGNDYRNYTHYVMNIAKKKIVSGWWNQNDAKDDQKEISSYGNNKNNYKVVSRQQLVKIGLDPKDDKNWGNAHDRADDNNQHNNESTEPDDDESFSDPINNFSEETEEKSKAFKIAAQALNKYKTAKEAKAYLHAYAMKSKDQKANIEIQKAIKLIDNMEGLDEGENDYDQYEFQSGSTYHESEASDKADTAVKKMTEKILNLCGGDKQKAISVLKQRQEDAKKDPKLASTIGGYEKCIKSLGEGDFKKLVAFKPKQNPISEEKEAKAIEKKPTDLTTRGDYYKSDKKGEKNADNVNYYEFTKGWRYELHLPHGGNCTKEEAEKAKTKVLKNLAKDPAYYSNLFAKEGMKRLGATPKEYKNKMGDITTPVDKENGMQVVKGVKNGKLTINSNSPSQDKNDKAQKASKKMRHVKESLIHYIKNMIKESISSNGNVQDMLALKNVKPEELAKKALDGYNQLSDTRKKVIAAILGKAVADGNTDQTVADAFHKLNDDIKEEYDNYNADPNVPGKKPGNLGISQLDKNIETNEDDSNDIEDDNVEGGIEERKSPLSGAEEKTAKHIKPALKSMEKEYGKDKGKGIFYATVRKRTKSEDVDNSEEDNDYSAHSNQTMQQEKNSSIYHAHPIAGKMHQILGVKDGEDISTKYKDGASLYNALMSKLHDHGKVQKMLAFAANIHKDQGGIFKSAMEHGKEDKPQQEHWKKTGGVEMKKLKGVKNYDTRDK